MAYTAFEGYDNQSDYHSSKEEKWERSKRAAKWMVLSLIIGCSLVYSVKLCVQDALLKLNGNSIVTEFKNGTTLSGVSEDGYAVTVEYQKKTTVKLVKSHYSEDNIESIETGSKEYGKNRATAFIDNNGIIRVVPIMFTMLSPFHMDKVTLYYYGDDSKNARAMNTIWFWFVLYILLILMLYLSMRAAYRINHPKSHVRLETEVDSKVLKNKFSELRKRKI